MANYKTGAQRYNDRMDKIMQNARKIEDERIAGGKRPNPNLTSSDDPRLSNKQRKQLSQEQKETMARRMKKFSEYKK